MQKNYVPILVFLVLLLTSCLEKHEPVVPSKAVPPVRKGLMAGKVIWPSNAKLDTTGVRVHSFKGAERIINDSYVADTINKFSTLFVTKPDGNIIMMRYNYPGQSDNDITPQSTALAILMNAPITLSLSDEGQLQMIQKIQMDPGYKHLVQEVTNAVVAGRAINDTTNASMLEATSRLFNNASNQRLLTYRGTPLKIRTSNPGTFSIENNRVAHKYVVGIYKENVRLESFIIEGTQAFASSFSEILNGVFGSGYSTPDQKIYTNTNDGIYMFKIRSGKPGTGDSALEYNEALNENVIYYAITLAFKHLPLIGAECIYSLKKAIQESIIGAVSLKEAKDANELTDKILDYCSHIFSTNTSLFEDCPNFEKPNYNSSFLPSVGKLFKFIGKVGEVGEALNITTHIYDLYNSRAAIDTCFQVLDKKVVACNSITSVKVDAGTVMPNDTSGFVHSTSIPLLIKYSGINPTRVAITTGGTQLPSEGDWQSVSATNGTLAYTFNTSFETMASRGMWKLKVYLRTEAGVSAPYSMNVHYSYLTSYTPPFTEGRTAEEVNRDALPISGIPSQVTSSNVKLGTYAVYSAEPSIICRGRSSELYINVQSNTLSEIQAGGYSHLKFYDGNGLPLTVLYLQPFRFYQRVCLNETESIYHARIKYVEVFFR
ncbi:hypothetical protein [Pontibacter roseus]|uniref:hypothetical protein n=1 Tax=Pontibacter roseus TaxID=336989 RepID=UPI0003A29B00|nr:hypothetical protein [Pontibacter roseus]